MGLFTKERIMFRKSFRIADLLADWVCDLNYVRSQASQTTSQSRTGSAHCEVIFCSYCAVRADWPMHGFSVNFQNAHAWITFRKSFAFMCSSQSGFLRGSRSKKTLFRVSKAWFERALHSQRVKSGFQIRKGSESRSEMAFRNVICCFVNMQAQYAMFTKIVTVSDMKYFHWIKCINFITALIVYIISTTNIANKLLSCEKQPLIL